MTHEKVDKFAGLTTSETDAIVGSDGVYKRKRDGHKRMGKRPFVSWDGEGAGDGKNEAQDYCVMGNSAYGLLRTDSGYLPTLEIFKFLIAEAKRLPYVINVAFGFGYDVNMILRDVPFPILKRIHSDNVAHWKGYRIEWFPSKWFMLSDRESGESIRIYDTIGFWHTNLASALEAQPELRDDPRLTLIREGKRDRGTFAHEELNTKIIPYFHAEMELHAALCELLRSTLEKVVVPTGGKSATLLPNEWYGPSAIIKTHYGKAGLKRAMNRPVSDLTRPRRRKHGRVQVPDKNMAYTLPDAVNEAARASFAGGRFEQFKIGIHDGPVYGYDITSAYPYAQTGLPQLRDGHWSFHTRDEIITMRKRLPRPLWGFYWIYYDFDRVKDSWRPYHHTFKWEPPQPLFRRDEYGTVSYPPFTAGWYPTFSAHLVWDRIGVEIQKCWIWNPDENSSLPFFPFESDDMVNLAHMYDMKDQYEREGRMDLRYATKITLNSGYGKTAQKRGVQEGDNLPAFHQIEWAAHITDHCRMEIFTAAMIAWSHGALISIETDAIYTTKPIQYLEERMSGGLGDWTRDDYEGICYLQSGIYFTKRNGEWSFHYRGLDRDSVTIDMAREHFEVMDYRADRWSSMFGTMSNFAGLGQSGISVVNHPNQFYAKWLCWPKTEKEIRLGQPHMKRAHSPRACKACIEGISPARELHDLIVPEYKSGKSIPRRYPWITTNPVESEFVDAQEERWS